MKNLRKLALSAVSLILSLTMLFSCSGASSITTGSTFGTSGPSTLPIVSDPIGGTPSDGESILLADATSMPVLYVDDNDAAQTVRAVGDLQADFERVTGRKPSVVNTPEEVGSAKTAVIIGTIGQSALIDRLVAGRAIDVTAVKGEWEAYTIAVLKDLDIGIENAIVIAGSDKRGTIYGIYELSEQIGVSPWYWWGDVEVVHSDKIELRLATLVQTEKPDVKYRGIFLNDEENMTNWSKKFISSTNKGAPNPEMYSHVFELLLRLKANTLWPSMHACSDAFNKYKNPKTGVSYNAELADSYGIVMSASHCEMMLRDNEGEWDDWAAANQRKYNIKKINNSWHDSYDYTVNAEAMNAYWEERVAENYRFENIYMIGLRGVHDSGINCSALSDRSYKGKATVVKAAVEAQLKILEKYEKLYAEETGKEVQFQTAYCVYKEAAEYYKYDIALPSDCYLMYCDDNHGYVRSTPTEEELSKYEGFGMYYHISYWGRPFSYLWVSNTPLPLIAEEMRKSYYSGMDDFWILNVGDIKPGELKTEYFMDLAWDVGSHTENNTEIFTDAFLRRDFRLDAVTSAQFATLLTDFYQIMRNYVPEQAGKDGMEYSVIAYGDEGQIVVNRLQEIYNRSLEILNSLPEAKRASYYEMIHYTVTTYLATMEKYVYEAKNHLAAEEGRYAAANLYAELSQNAYLRVISETEYFNNNLMNGKWNGIINPYNTAQPTIDGAPTLYTFSKAEAKGGIQLSGEKLTFGSLNDNRRFVDIVNLGSEKAEWTLSAPVWLKLSDRNGTPLVGSLADNRMIYTGSVEVESRLILSVDWEKLSAASKVDDFITVADRSGKTSRVELIAVKTEVNPDEKKGYYEENGVVAIEAEHFNKNVAQGGFEWKLIDGLGRIGGSMLATATEGFSNKRIGSNYKTTAPYLEYDIYFTTPGSYQTIIYRLPTLNESASSRTSCRIAWSLDDGSVQTVRGTTTADDSDTSPWAQMIKLHAEKMKLTLNVESAGWHTFRIYMSDANMVVDRITMVLGSEVFSRLGSPETFQNIGGWQTPEIGITPDFTLDDVDWQIYTKYFDFAASSTEKVAGTVTITKAPAETDDFRWTPGSDTAEYDRSGASKFAVIDRGLIAGSKRSTLVLRLPASARYAITLTVGDPTGAIKAKGMSVVCNGKKVLSAISTTTAATVPYYFTATSTKNGEITLVFDGEWVLNSLEVFSYSEVPTAVGKKFLPSESGIIAIEAETALEKSAVASMTVSTDGTKRWIEVAGEVGSALFFGPNSGTSYSSVEAASPTAKLNYTVELESGRYSVWALVKCAGEDDDSIIFSIDGKSGQTVNDLRNTDGFVWKQITSYSVDAGSHTLTVMGREDGFTIDRILLVPEGCTPEFGTSMNRG